MNGKRSEDGLILLTQASLEIKQLRRKNELMSARLEMFDNMMSLINIRINDKSVGMSPDLV